jgi:hypothetical protein
VQGNSLTQFVFCGKKLPLKNLARLLHKPRCSSSLLFLAGFSFAGETGFLLQHVVVVHAAAKGVANKQQSLSGLPLFCVETLLSAAD